MLLGRFYTQITEKGRVALPAKFRKITGDRIVIARWYENCLVIVGASGWDSLINRLGGPKEVVIRPIRSVERFILSTAFEVETDDQGRFVVPSVLREVAGLKSDVVFLGLGERIELWDTSIWQKEEEKVKAEADQVLIEIAKSQKQ